ncbi:MULTISPECIES: hypothetical protein [Salinibaculum]|uniref:hypothetical protein n=1 Tax=Salinibaculum TaxID=2732368 RepID=UPI0030CC39B5
MTDTRTYRCLNCLEHTVEREYDVSHISFTCDNCGEFGRFVHDGVYAKYEDFEDSPPDALAWDRLSRMEKFRVAERIVRAGKTLDDFDVGNG